MAAPESSSEPLLTRRQERLALAALTLGAFAMALNSNVMAPLFPFLAPELGIDKQQWGVLLAAAGIAGGVAALLLGPVIDRFGRRPPMLLGSVLFTAASLGHVWAESYGTLLAARAAAGFGVGVVFTGASAAVADLIPYERRGAAMGIFSAGIFLAAALGLPLANQLALHGQWRTIFVVQAVFAAVTMIAYWRVVPSRLGQAGAWVSQVRVLREPGVVAGLLSVLLYTGAFFTTVSFIGKWLDEASIVPKENQAMMWVVLGLGSAIGSLILPRLADRIGKRTFVLLSTAGVAICLLLLTRVDSVATLFAVGLPLTLIAAARSGSFQALMSEIVPGRMRGSLMGIRAAAVNLGMGGFTWVGGHIYADHDFDGVLYCAALAVVAAYFLVRVGMREVR